MMMKKTHRFTSWTTVVFAVLLSLAQAGCDPPDPNGNGYTVRTVTKVAGSPAPPVGYSVGDLEGELVVADRSATGSTASWSGSTGFTNGYTAASPSTVIVPGEWTHITFDGPCAFQRTTGFYNPHDRHDLVCLIVPKMFAVDPSIVDAGGTRPLPNLVNIYGENMSSTFGNPVVLVYDSTGAVVGSATASFVSGDGTSIQVPADLISSAVYSGTYTLSINNVTADGSLDQTGIAYITLTGLPDPPPPPPPPQPPVDPCPTNPCLPQD